MERFNPLLFKSRRRFRSDQIPPVVSGDIVKELAGKKTFIVTDANLIKAGILIPIFESIRQHDLPDPVVFDQVPPDSDLACVITATKLAKDNECDCVIAVGGGSVTDTAKVVNIRLTFSGELMEYQGINTLKSGDDLAARSATLIASTMGGLAFTNAGVGIVHALAQPPANAVFLPYGMEFNLDVVASR